MQQLECKLTGNSKIAGPVFAICVDSDSPDAPIVHIMFSLLFISETCRDVLCPGSSTCVVDQNNNANCVTCNRICPEPTLPEQYLCGNDGITYASACHLRKATCLLGRSIGLAYEGKCVSKYHGTRDYCSIFKMRGDTQRGKFFHLMRKLYFIAQT